MRLLLLAFTLLLATLSHALPFEEDPRIARLFEQAGVNGAFVLLDVSAQRLIGHNQNRARTRFVPASTYKVPHTLIGLATGAITDVDEVLRYGGKPQPFPQWERDMSLREAIGLSNVPIYQALARRIGVERMQAHLDRLSYGNGEVGSVVDRFWLEGPLRISAIEQAEFLARLAQQQLPVPVEAQQQTAAIVELETYRGATLFGKTGWENAPGPGAGWWVGWVATAAPERLYTFALNVDITEPADGDKRVPVGKAALRALGAWPE